MATLRFGVSGLLCGCLLAAAAGHASATQTYFIDGAAASLDRWMYPYGDFSGSRTSAPTYTTVFSGYTQFDDRDSEFLTGFNTGSSVPTGFSPFQYRLTSVILRTTCQVSDATSSFVYDPSLDPLSSYFDAGDPTANPPRAADPTRTDDPDAGRPVELYAVAYRGGFTAQTWAENSPFGPASPAPGTRNVYPIDFGGPAGMARDVSNNVTQRFEPLPLAVGSAKTQDGSPMTAGETMADGATMDFSVDLSTESNAEYVQSSLSQGKLNLLVSSLHPATAFGAGPVTYPVFRTKESLLGGAPRIVVSVSLCLADIGKAGGEFGRDGALDNNDFISFIDRFFNQEMGVADIGKAGGEFGRDGALDNNDFIVFIGAFFDGCP